MTSNTTSECLHPPMRRSPVMTNDVTIGLLHSSIVWFGVIAAILSSLIAKLIWTVLPGLGVLGTAQVPATILSSILCWWLFIVRPRRVTILRGILAGIVSIVCALFLMLWFFAYYLLLVEHSWTIDLFTLFTLLTEAVLVALVVSITPLGWILFLIGGSAGGLLASYLRRSVLPNANTDSQVF